MANVCVVSKRRGSHWSARLTKSTYSWRATKYINYKFKRSAVQLYNSIEKFASDDYTTRKRNWPICQQGKFVIQVRSGIALERFTSRPVLSRLNAESKGKILCKSSKHGHFHRCCEYPKKKEQTGNWFLLLIRVTTLSDRVRPLLEQPNKLQVHITRVLVRHIPFLLNVSNSDIHMVCWAYFSHNMR